MAGGLLPALAIDGTPVSGTFTGVESKVVIPNNGEGNKPRFIHVACTTDCYILTVLAAGPDVAAAAGLLLKASGGGLILNTSGATNISVIQESAGGSITLTPLANQ